MKLLIRQGRLIDPVGGIGGVMDILLEDGKVAVIGSDLSSERAETIDARGLGMAAGAALGMTMSATKTRNIKRAADKAIKAVGEVVENISDSMGM